MRADPTEMIQRARAIRDRAEAEREEATILRESATTLRRLAQDVREAISRQLTEARQSSDERSCFSSDRSESSSA